MVTSLPPKLQRPLKLALPLLVLLILFGSALSSLQFSSPTYDEHEYISRGYLYLQTGNTSLKLRHPILLDTLAAWPLRLLPEIELPRDDPALAAGDFHLYAAHFMWQANAARLTQIFFLARLPAIALLLVLVAAVYRWAYERFGWTAALVALLLAAFDPNLLAHGRLVTPDVGQTAFIFFATFAWWRYWQKSTLWRLLTAGVLLGLAQTAGYPALILYPLFFIIGLLHIGYTNQWRTAAWLHLRYYILLVLVSAVTIWAVYGFSWGPVNAFDYILNLPAPYYFEEFVDLLSRLSRDDLAYLNGEVYRGGRWQFFVVGLFIKTPLPILLLGSAGLLLLLYQRRLAQDAALWLIPIVYYAVALSSSLNIGYRHIIPILPFLYIWGGSAVTALPTQRPWPRWTATVLLLWLVIASWHIYPFYLTYFNELVGGPPNGLNYLVIADLDWGQDLPQLKQYMTDNNIEEVYLSYFGTVPPELYGIDYRPLPAWPPRGLPEQLPFHPQYPLPGVYAISAANLVGSHFEDNPNLYSFFRAQTPQARLGNSIYIYEVGVQPQDSAQVHWVSDGVPLSELPAEFIAKSMGSNNIAPRWFNGQGALIFPHGRTLMHINNDRPLDPDLEALLTQLMPPPETLTVNTELNSHYYIVNDAQAQLNDYLAQQTPTTVYEEPAACVNSNPIQTPVVFSNTAAFLGWQPLTDLTAAQPYKALSFWRIEREITAPLSIFVHWLAPDGSIIAQSDGFDVSSSYLQTGDIVVQLHQWHTPDNLPSDSCWLTIGLYQRNTLQRLTTSLGAERLFIPSR